MAGYYVRKAHIGQRRNLVALGFFFSIDAQSLTSAFLGPIRSTSVQNVPRVSTKVCLTLVCLSFTTHACKSLLFFACFWVFCLFFSFFFIIFKTFLIGRVSGERQKSPSLSLPRPTVWCLPSEVMTVSSWAGVQPDLTSFQLFNFRF